MYSVSLTDLKCRITTPYLTFCDRGMELYHILLYVFGTAV